MGEGGIATPKQAAAEADFVNMRAADNQLTQGAERFPDLKDPKIVEAVQKQYQQNLEKIVDNIKADPNYLENFGRLNNEELTYIRDHLAKTDISPADLGYLDDMIKGSSGGRP